MARIERCIDRLLSRSPTNGAREQQSRRYVRDTYCALFEQNDWVYDDGALRIAAQSWLERGSVGACSTGSATTPAGMAPCKAESVIDCALLHHVRRVEVQAYIADRRQSRGVQCDDGTPLKDLGVP